MSEEKYALTPLMRQYYNIKAEYPDALLLFRAGDFYETFGDDAVKASSILGITLTKRANGSASSVPLAGFPYHAIDNYLDKLVLAGERVAICEQLEDPKTAKGIVKRGVTELVTPGVTYNDSILRHKENTFVAAVVFGESGKAGVSFLDISTGEFYVGEGGYDFVTKITSGLSPKEMLYSREQVTQFDNVFGGMTFSPYRLDEWAWSSSTNRDKLMRQLGTKSLKGFGIENLNYGITAAGAILHYLEYTKHSSLSHINSISRIDENRYVWVDRYSMRNLELFIPTAEGGGTLIDTIDRASSPMGKRMLRRWLALPLCEKKAIEARYDVVEYLAANEELRYLLSDNLNSMGDPERTIARVAALRAMPRDLVQLSRSIAAMENVAKLARSCDSKALEAMGDRIEDLGEVRKKIALTMCEEPAPMLGKGMVIAAGVDAELDRLRSISNGGKDYLEKIVEREIQNTGITSLKISYNNVFGYYIEVRNTHKDKVPAEWIRKQTLVNAERYITEELKQYEETILGAEGKIAQIENRIFGELISWLQPFVAAIKSSATATAEIDALLSFAIIAVENKYCRPTLNDKGVVKFTDLRHPVIERRLSLGESYIPSDVALDNKDHQILLISGPNMSGKSALLRSVALATLMAQCGSFVAAKTADIMIADRIFTRVGASDNISSGESTFMVEMLETANILNNITDRSLVILDEIGRGTSTYDGISIAWAIVEHIHSSCMAKVMFATHYHELGEMERQFPRVKNYHIEVREVDQRIIFLRKLSRGAAEHSFGIHVASMAGMPPSVVRRAQTILTELETQRGGDNTRTVESLKKVGDKPLQLSFFQMDDPTLSAVADQIRGIDIDSLTPLQALNKLSEIKKIVGIKK